MNIILLNSNESFRKFLNPDMVEVNEIQEKGVVDNLEIVYPLTGNFEEDFEDWKPGNKVFVQDFEGLKTCLYVITSEIDKDLWKDNNISVTLEEVLIELNYTPVISQLDTQTKSVSVNRTNLEAWFGKWYNIGDVVQPTKHTIIINGSLTRMELLRQIEEDTGGIFTTEYEKEPNSNRIKRTLHYKTVEETGTDHTSSVIDLGYNVENIVYKIDESECYSSISPGLHYDEGSNASITRADVTTLLKRFKNLKVSVGDTVPLYLGDEVTTAPYPTRSECQKNNTYWTRLPGDSTYNWYSSPLTYGGKFTHTTTQMNQSNTPGSKGKFYICNDAGTYNYWTGSTTNSISCQVDDVWVCNGTTWKVIHKSTSGGTGNVIKYSEAEATWNAPFQKNAGELFITTDYEELDYDHIFSRSDLDGTPAGVNEDYIIPNPEAYEDIDEAEGDNLPDAYYQHSTPKTGVYEISEKDTCLIYNKLVWELNTRSTPDVTIDINLKALNPNIKYNIYDKVYVKIPTFKDLIRCTLTKTEKNPRVVGENKVTVESWKEKSQIETITNVELQVASSKQTPNKSFNLTGKLVKNTYNIVDGEVVVDEEPLANKNVTLYITKPDSIKTTNITYVTKGAYTDLTYNAYGISHDKKYICGIGRKTAPADKYAYKYYMKGVFRNKCPYCGKATLFWAPGTHGRQVYNPYKKKWVTEGNTFSSEGHIFCSNCDMDWSAGEGNEHVYSYQKNHKLSRVSLAKSSLTEFKTLEKGKLLYKTVKSKDVAKHTVETVKVKGWKHVYTVKTNSSGVFKKSLKLEGLENSNYIVNAYFNDGKTGGKCSANGIIQVPTKASKKTITLKTSSYTPHVIIPRNGSLGQSGVVSTTVQNKAKQIIGKQTGLSAVKTIANWVSNRGNIGYHDHNNFTKSPNSTLSKRSGNCCEKADLFCHLLEGADLLYAQDSSKGVIVYYRHVYGHVYNVVKYRDGAGTWHTVNVDVTKSSNPWGNVCSGFATSGGNVTRYPNLPFQRSY